MQKSKILLLTVSLFCLVFLFACKEQNEEEAYQFMEELSASVSAEGGSVTFDTKSGESFFYVDYVSTIQGNDTTTYTIDVSHVEAQSISEDWFKITTQLDSVTSAPSSLNVELASNNSGEDRILLINIFSWDYANSLTITQASTSE